LPVIVLLVHRQSPHLDGGPRRGAAHIQPSRRRPSPTKRRPLWCARRPRARRSVVMPKVSSRAADKAQQAITAFGIGRVPEQKVGGRERVDLERVDRALAGVASSRRSGQCHSAPRRRARRRRPVARREHTRSGPAVCQHEALVPVELVLDGLPGGAHRGKTNTVNGLNEGTTAPEHLVAILPCTASIFTGFPAPVWCLQARRDCASRELASCL